jgi:hypothetical protein
MKIYFYHGVLLIRNEVFQVKKARLILLIVRQCTINLSIDHEEENKRGYIVKIARHLGEARARIKA